LSKVLRDAFLMLVYPTLKNMCTDKLIARIREHKVEKPLEDVVLSSQTSEGSNLDMTLDSNINASNNEVVYDLLFRRYQHHEDHHVQNDNYSSLTEINHLMLG
jgi:hypothetical protein